MGAFVVSIPGREQKNVKIIHRHERVFRIVFPVVRYGAYYDNGIKRWVMKKILLLVFMILSTSALWADIIDYNEKRINVCNKIINISDFKEVKVAVCSSPYCDKQKTEPVHVKENECLPTAYMPLYIFSVDGKTFETYNISPYRTVHKMLPLKVENNFFKIVASDDTKMFILQKVRIERIYAWKFFALLVLSGVLGFILLLKNRKK